MPQSPREITGTKAVSSHRAARPAWGAYAFKRLILILLLTLPAGAAAQSCEWRSAFHNGESLTYDLYFKWGILMPRAGIAHFTVRETAYKGKAWEYKLQFNTTGMFDKVYRMRDTLTTYFTEDNRVIFSDKRTEEGGYYLVDQLTFTGGTAGAASGRAAGNAGSSASVHSFRYARSGVKIDTTLVVEGCLYDMMAATMYLRSIDWAGLRVKDEYPFRVIVGRDVVNVSYRYTGQAVVSPDEKTRYRTHHFYIDVYDPAFEQSKEAAEVWVGDDANHLPIRVRAKLKIGAVEVYIKTAATLKHPFTSKISIADAFYR